MSEEFLIRSLTELSIGAPVVHIDHGVGRYARLDDAGIDQRITNFTADYADGAKVYVPVTNLHLISHYSGGDLILHLCINWVMIHGKKRKALKNP